MLTEGTATLLVAVIGLFATWGAWVTVMVFELKAKILLIHQEIEVLIRVKELLEDIRDQKKGRTRHE